MAKVIDNLVTEGLSGMIGKQLVFRHLRNGKTIVTAAPNFSNRVFSEGQLAHQSRFQQAAAYAKVAAKTQPLYAELARQTQQPAYNIALSDWFHAPVIHTISCFPGCISVQATDNVQVTQVLITILDEQGKILEQGNASPVEDSLWEYKASTTGDILVEAFDHAGNVTRQSSIRLLHSLRIGKTSEGIE